MTSLIDSHDTEAQVPLRVVVDNPGLALEVVRESLRAGALELPVRWAHVSELRDPGPYLVGQELLLTAGVNLPAEPDELDRYVRGLRAAGITALGFGVTPPMREALPEDLRAACVRHGLPLLVVWPRTPFLAISKAVAVALATAGKREQRRVAEAREALTKAAGEGTAALAGSLSARVGGWVALVGDGAEPAVQHGAPRPLPGGVVELFGTLRAGTGIRSATTELADGTVVLAQPVYPQATASQLLAVGRRRRFDGADRAIVAVGAALLGLASRAGSDTAGLGGGLTALLLGTAPPGTAIAGLLRGAEWRVVAGTPHRRGPGAVERGYDWLRTHLGTPLVEVSGARFIAIVDEEPALGRLEHLRANGWLTAVGTPRPAGELGDAHAEIEGILARARALGRPVVAERKTGLDGLDGLVSLVSADAAGDFARRLLAPVLELDRERDADLVRTLRTWLAQHGGWDRTAAALGVHRNSVRHRIGLVERALGADLADPETRMELWFALRWLSTRDSRDAR
ncbi:PucR family transcriptional regulator [Amycolatopsis minnesotensis]|uniref:PucR family transcriptional regulator n=1 Tax=Amycolatopsis minnesotensis TaxID=337894 RepID=A0ABN2Q5Q2_9PSEU